MYFSECFDDIVTCLSFIANNMERDLFVYDTEPEQHMVSYAYMSHNRDAYCAAVASLTNGYEIIYAIKRTEPLSDQYLRNLNVISPYRYRLTDHAGGKICRNLFIDDLFVGMSIKEISSEPSRAKHYINNVLSMVINLIAGRFDQLEVDHRNMFGIIVTTVICNKLGLPLTPEFLADALGTNKVIAEQVIEKFDYEANEFIGLPWYI